MDSARQSDRSSATATDSSIDDRAEEFATVILAVAPQHAGALLAGMIETQEARSRIDELAYEPIVTCYLQYGTDMRLPAPMLGFSGGILQWAFDRGQLGTPAMPD